MNQQITEQANNIDRIEVIIHYKSGENEPFDIMLDESKEIEPEYPQTEEEFNEYIKELKDKEDDIQDIIVEAITDAVMQIKEAASGKSIQGTDIICYIPGHFYAGLGVKLCFQKGPVQESGRNGANHEDVMKVLIDRLEYFQKEHQDGKFACRENAISITKQEESLMWQEKRMNDRRARGVEGRNIV